MMHGARAWWRSSAVLVSLLLALAVGAFADDGSMEQTAPVRATGHLSALLPNVTLGVRVGAEAPTASRMTVKRGHARTLLATVAAHAVRRDSWQRQSGSCIATSSRRAVSSYTQRDRAPPARLTLI